MTVMERATLDPNICLTTVKIYIIVIQIKPSHIPFCLVDGGEGHPVRPFLRGQKCFITGLKKKERLN